MITASHENYRRDILNFYDACRNGQKHTKEQFDSVIRQCDYYEKYIHDHDVKNGVIETAIKEIRRLYESWTIQDTLNRMIEEEIKEAKKLSDIDSLPKPLLCPNCGAPLHGHKCEYCDTEFIQAPSNESIEIKLHLFDEQRKLNDICNSMIKALRPYHF